MQFLWTEVGYCSDHLFEVVCVLRLDQPKICNQRIPLLIDENVLQLEVIQNDPQFVQILQPQNDPRQYKTHIILIRFIKNCSLS